MWMVDKLDNLFKFNVAGDMKKELFNDVKTSEYPYPLYGNAVEHKGLMGFYKEFKYDKNTITVTARGNIGVSNFRKSKFNAIGRLIILNKKIPLNMKFFTYVLNNLKIYVESTGVPQLTAPSLKINKVYHPSIDEQEKIANFLLAIDKKIELMEKKYQLLEKIKRCFLFNLFPQNEGNPFIRFNKNYGDWEIKKISEIVDIHGRIGFRGYTTKDFVNEGEGALTIGAKHIVNDRLNLKEPEFICWDKYYESPEIMVNKGDILLSKTGTIGKVAIVGDIKKSTINPNLVLLNNFRVNNMFLYYLISTNTFKKELNRNSTLTSVPMVNQENINNIKIKIPSYDEQKKISTFLNNVDLKIESYIKEIELNKEFKRSLLSKMFC